MLTTCRCWVVLKRYMIVMPRNTNGFLPNRLYSVCPSVDPQYLLATLPGTDALLATYSPPFAQCGSVLQQTSCEKDLGYQALPASLTYLSAPPSTSGTASYTSLSGLLASPTASVVPYVPVSYTHLTLPTKRIV